MKLFYTISLMFIIYLPVFTGSRFYHPLIGAAWANKDRNEIPVLCYHNITLNGEKEDPLWIGKERFSEQLKMLYDSGYHTILPGQLYEYLTKGTPLPSKPIILSFDDSHEAHYTIASPAMHGETVKCDS